MAVESTPMLDHFMKVKGKHPDAILFYRMGDFYEMFYDDAKIASEVLGIRLTSRSHGKSGQKVPLAGFPYHQLDAYLTRMVQAGKRVVIVEQVEDPKKAKGLVKRDVVQIVTSGTNTASIDNDAAGVQRVAALIRLDRKCGLAWMDVTTGEFSTTELTENELSNMLSIVSPVEIVVPENSVYFNELKPFMANKTVISKLEDWIWELEFARNTLLDHFKTANLKGFGVENHRIAICAAGALFYYVKTNLHIKPAHVTGLSFAQSEGKLYIDSSSIRNLELLESLTGNNRATLFSVLDKTVTMTGRRLLISRLLEPLSDKKLIDQRLDAVGELLREDELREKIRNLLKECGDLQRMVARLAIGRGTARDLAGLREAISLLPNFKVLLGNAKSSLLSVLVDKIDVLSEIHTELSDCIADEPPAQINDGGMIKRGFNQELDELHSIHKDGRSWLAEYEKNERIRSGIPNLKVGYNKVFGYFIEISKSHTGKAPSDYIRKQTLVNGERYTTSTLDEYQEKVLNAHESICSLEYDLFQKIVTKVLTKSETIQLNARILAELDFYSALAQSAEINNFKRPEMIEKPSLMIKDGRHPVVESLLPPGEKFVPNDIEIGGKSTIHILTGPNMAGKSTYLRQIALIVILAHLGSYIPADAGVIGIVDKLYTRIGALDNLAGGESTFLVEMQETASILNNCTAKSLVLFDEVGRGTSTFDGLSLAWAIVEYLHSMEGKCPRTLFATHFHEMVSMAEHLPKISNWNVAVKETGSKVVFLRKIIAGGCDQSFGIHVAQMAGLPKIVIDRANEILQNLESNDLNVIQQGKETPDKPKRKQPQRQAVQLSFFDVKENRLKDKLREVDLDKMTPLQALHYLAELKNYIDF